MTKAMRMNARVSDKARVDNEAIQRLEAELTHAFAAPDSAYRPLAADEVIQRNRRRRSI